MMTDDAPRPATEDAPRPATRETPRWLMPLIAVAAGLVVANLYYAQPLAGPIGAVLGMAPGSAGLIVTLTQVGYVAGLVLIVPLADLVENRRLVVLLLAVSAVALLAAGLATHPAPFLLACLAVGVGSVAVQVLVPYASHLAHESVRGRAVGTVLSGLMLGIMLARPASSALAALVSWHAPFFLSAAVMAVLACVLGTVLPRRLPDAALGYAALLRSMATLFRRTPVLRRRAALQFFLFGAFSLFWTTVPLLLAGPAFRLSQGGIALFAFAGVAGAVAAPIAGRWADRGWTRPATAGAILSVLAAFGLGLLQRPAAPGESGPALALLVVAAIVLDFGVTANLTLGQRAIFLLPPAERGRLNGLFLATFFVGGALGSALGGWAFAAGGWVAASLVGAALPAAALVLFAMERRAAGLPPGITPG